MPHRDSSVRYWPDGGMAAYPEAPTNLQVLRASTLLNSLTEEQISDLGGVSHMAYAERAETIWINGSDVDFFGVVGIGFVKMTRSTAAGHDVTTELMGPGQVFGLLGALEGTGCPQTAKAVCNTWYLKVPKRKFFDVYRENLILKETLVRRTTTRLRSSYEMIARMSTGKVDQRIAAILFLVAESYGTEDGKTIRINVPLTRQDIAEMAGTTVESTIRVMSAWQKKKWIETESRTISILNPDSLAELI